MTCGEEKNQSIKKDPKMTQIIQLVCKNIKTAFITIFHIFKKTA